MRRSPTAISPQITPAPENPKMNSKYISTYFRSGLGVLFQGVIVYTLIAFGGTDLLGLSFSAAGLALLFGLSAAFPLESRSALASWLICAIVALLLGGYAWAQTVTGLIPAIENSQWSVARNLLSSVQGTISVAPMQTLTAILALSPLLGFGICMRLYPGQNAARLLLERLNFLNAALALFGLVQELFFPFSMLLGKKEFYFGSLTSVFINRNTAGTFFGMGLLLSVGLALHQLKSHDISRLCRHLFELKREKIRRYDQLFVAIALATIQAVALFLTQSRGAVAATFFGAIILVLILSRHGLTMARPASITKGTWLQRIGVPLLALTVIFGLSASRAMQRLEALGTADDRWCAYQATVQAIEATWPYGSGLGTFPDIFPAYRLANCGAVRSIWDAAHNVFLEGFLTLGAVFIVGLACIYITFLLILRAGLKNRHRSRFAPAVFAGLMILLSLHSLVDFSLQTPGLALFASAVFGCLTTICLKKAQVVSPEFSGIPQKA